VIAVMHDKHDTNWLPHLLKQGRKWEILHQALITLDRFGVVM